MKRSENCILSRENSNERLKEEVSRIVYKFSSSSVAHNVKFYDNVQSSISYICDEELIVTLLKLARAISLKLFNRSSSDSRRKAQGREIRFPLARKHE